jgi:hypothetical protein
MVRTQASRGAPESRAPRFSSNTFLILSLPCTEIHMFSEKSNIPSVDHRWDLFATQNEET